MMALRSYMSLAPVIDTLYLYQDKAFVNTLYRKRYGNAMTPGQARAARALLKLGVRDVGEMAGVTPNTVSRVEQDEVSGRGPQTTTVAAIQRVYEAAGVIFIAENGEGPGVRLRKSAGSPNAGKRPDELDATNDD